jgi:predicted DNA-binding protein (MmcQ/YjbR family)
MDIEIITTICRALPFVTEDIKWGHDLCFMIGGKMFCVVMLDGPLKVSFKVTEEEFGEMSESIGIKPAPYVARYKWLLVEDASIFNKQKWKHYIDQSYNLVRAKLPKTVLKELDKTV